MRVWMRVATVVVLLCVVLSLGACCTPPTKIATIENVSVRYETLPRNGQEASTWGPGEVKKIVFTPDQLLIFEKNNRATAVVLLDLKFVEWERVGVGKASGE